MSYNNSRITLPIMVERPDILHLQDIMKAELFYYNSVISSLHPYFLKNPEIFLDIDTDMIALYGSLCEMGINFSILDKEKLTDTFKSLQNTITEVSKNVILNQIFCSLPRYGGLLPHIQKGMGREILKFYIEQSKNKKMNRQIKILEQQEFKCKRHIQMKRKDIISTYDEIKNTSTIISPYNKCKMIIKNYNLPKMNNWNICILRQQPERLGGKKVLTLQSPWILYISEEKNDYLIHFLDQQ